MEHYRQMFIHQGEPGVCDLVDEGDKSIFFFNDLSLVCVFLSTQLFYQFR